MSHEDSSFSRRQLMRNVARHAALGGVGSLAAWLLHRQSGLAAACPGGNASCSDCSQAGECRLPQVWQIDPNLCSACGRCQTNCVLDLSAAKVVNCFALCGYCDKCTGYFPETDEVWVASSKGSKLSVTGAEHQLCPTGAISRKFIEQRAGERYFEYTIDETLCIACGKCVKGCKSMNSSLFLQVRHDRCLNCNECSIAVGCPTRAFRRVPAAAPRLLSRAAQAAEAAMARKRKKSNA